jgi:hypothetical protein
MLFICISHNNTADEKMSSFSRSQRMAAECTLPHLPNHHLILVQNSLASQNQTGHRSIRFDDGKVLPRLFCDDFHVCNAQPLKKPSYDASPAIFRWHCEKFDRNWHLQRLISFRAKSGRNWI